MDFAGPYGPYVALHSASAGGLVINLTAYAAMAAPAVSGINAASIARAWPAPGQQPRAGTVGRARTRGASRAGYPSSSRSARVLVVSRGTPGPIVVVMVTLRRYLPLAAAGLARMISPRISL